MEEVVADLRTETHPGLALVRGRLLGLALAWRYATLALAFALLVVCLGLVGSGRIDFSFMPKVEAERVTAAVSMPYGTPVETTREVQRRLLEGSGQQREFFLVPHDLRILTVRTRRGVAVSTFKVRGGAVTISPCLGIRPNE